MKANDGNALSCSDPKIFLQLLTMCRKGLPALLRRITLPNAHFAFSELLACRKFAREKLGWLKSLNY